MSNLVLSVLLVAAFAIAPSVAQRKVVCYYSSWAVYRPGNGHFEVEDINPALCSHAIYAFIGLGEDGSVFSKDPSNDITAGGFQRFNDLRLVNPVLKTLVSIGGWNTPSSTFSTVVGDVALRQTLVDNLHAFVLQYGFSGLDLDWEFPGKRGGAPEDKANLVLLVEELRARFSPDGLLLTAAVSPDADAVEISYNVSALASNLDFIHLMTFDYHGPWENVTGIVSPLYADPDEQDATRNVDATVQLWRREGAPVSKLVLGVPLYGRSFTLESAENGRVGAPATGPGAPGPYTQEAGVLGYHEICESLQEGGWTEVWQVDQQVPFMFKDDFWVGHENVVSARLKAEYANRYRLAGVMVSAVDMDDFRDLCGTGAFPLLTAIKSVFSK